MSQKGWRCAGCMILFGYDELHVFYDPGMDELRHLFIHSDDEGRRYYENCGPITIMITNELDHGDSNDNCRN